LVLSGSYSPENYWKLSYTYQDPRDGDTGSRLPDVPHHRATAAINYGINRYLNLHTDILWTGKRPRKAGDTRDDADSYTTVDLALTVKNFSRPRRFREPSIIFLMQIIQTPIPLALYS
jgi:outer membrane receptor for ferrienterochelin and colicin